MADQGRPVALVTGVGRRAGIGAAIVERLAKDGWDVGFTYWRPYDDRMAWGRDGQAPNRIAEAAQGFGARVLHVEADLAEPSAPEALFRQIGAALGPIRALVIAHCESVDSTIMDTTLESFERHFAVNARASWLLIRRFAEQFPGPPGTGRIIALTSDHTAGNLPYGASKGALDRIVIASALELKHLGVSANAINPGPTQTGWIDGDGAASLRERTPAGRVGTPADAANLVGFLCSPQGGWVNGQLPTATEASPYADTPAALPARRSVPRSVKALSGQGAGVEGGGPEFRQPACEVRDCFGWYVCGSGRLVGQASSGRMVIVGEQAGRRVVQARVPVGDLQAVEELRERPCGGVVAARRWRQEDPVAAEAAAKVGDLAAGEGADGVGGQFLPSACAVDDHPARPDAVAQDEDVARVVFDLCVSQPLAGHRIYGALVLDLVTLDLVRDEREEFLDERVTVRPGAQAREVDH